MQYSTLPTSEHELVTLRPITGADIAAWYTYLSLPAVYEHTSWNLSSAAELLPYAIDPDPQAPDSMLRLAVASRSTGVLVGTVGFHSVSARDFRAEIAYDLAPEMWRKGVATYLVGVLVQWAHREAGIIRVQATTLQSNVASEAVLRRCGFAYEGLLRSYRMVRGKPGDFCSYSHLGRFAPSATPHAKR